MQTNKGKYENAARLTIKLSSRKIQQSLIQISFMIKRKVGRTTTTNTKPTHIWLFMNVPVGTLIHRTAVAQQKFADHFD